MAEIMASSTEELVLTDTMRAHSSGYEEAGHNSVHNRASRASQLEDSVQVDLPPVDRGKQAWLFLTGSFFVEFFIWGFPFSFGIFQKYYQTHPPFSNQPAGITIIGTSAMGIMYLSAPFVASMLQRYPSYVRPVQFGGLFLMFISLLASSFATKVWQLILTQGVLFGISGGLAYFPTIPMMDQWFHQRKGLAFGVMWAGTGVSGVVIPFVMEWGLNKHGSSTMLRAWSMVLLLFTVPILFVVKHRIPVSRSTYPRPLNFAFLKSSRFWLLQVGNIIEGLGFFIPGIYLPTYAQALGRSSLDGAILLAFFNLASVFGAVIFGTLTDRIHVTTAILISALGSAISVFCGWGLATSFPFLCIFSLLYGLFAGGYSSTWTGIIREIKKHDDRAEMIMVIGALAAGRGVGSVSSGPLSEALVQGRPWAGSASLGYGSGYGPLMVFTGISALLGGCGWIGRRVGWV